MAQEAIFDPVVVAMPLDGENELVRAANEAISGPGIAVRSSDDARWALRVAHRVTAGTVWFGLD
jgi:phenylacetaldehyde dehydrogenase